MPPQNEKMKIDLYLVQQFTFFLFTFVFRKSKSINNKSYPTVFFKRLNNHLFVKEMKIQRIVLKYNLVFRK